jgi:hypothetical protein
MRMSRNIVCVVAAVYIAMNVFISAQMYSQDTTEQGWQVEVITRTADDEPLSHVPFRIVSENRSIEGITDANGHSRVSVPADILEARVCIVWAWFSMDLLPDGMSQDEHRKHLRQICKTYHIDVARKINFTTSPHPTVEFIGHPVVSVSGRVVDHEGIPASAIVFGGTCGNFVSAAQKTKLFQLSGVPKGKSSELLVVAINTTTDQLGFWHTIQESESHEDIHDLVIQAPKYQPDSNLYFEAHSVATSAYSGQGLGYGVTLVHEEGQYAVCFTLRPKDGVYKARLDPLPVQAGTYYVIPGRTNSRIEFHDFMACVRSGADLEEAGIPKVVCSPGKDARIVLDIAATNEAMFKLGQCNSNAARNDSEKTSGGGQETESEKD